MCGDGEREEVVKLLPVVQSLNIVYGQVLLQLWTDTGERVQRCGGREGGGGRGEGRGWRGEWQRGGVAERGEWQRGGRGRERGEAEREGEREKTVKERR